jgi:hypothetical protein
VLSKLSCSVSYENYDVNFEAVNSRTDSKVCNWKTAAISFIFLMIVLMISKILNIQICLNSLSELGHLDVIQYCGPYNISLTKVCAIMYERLDWLKSAVR